MENISLEERVANLEAEVARLSQERQTSVQTSAAWLDKYFGIFKDNPEFEEAVKAGREWRESQGFPEDEDAAA